MSASPDELEEQLDPGGDPLGEFDDDHDGDDGARQGDAGDEGDEGDEGDVGDEDDEDDEGDGNVRRSHVHQDAFAGGGGVTEWIDDSLDLHPVDHPASRFLGKEFLLWLWWRSEEDFGSTELPHFGKVDFWIDDRLQFRTEGDDPQTSDFKGGAPSTTAEARMALVTGKIVETATIGLRVKEREYALLVKGEGMELAGVKVPSEVDDGVDELIFERMFLLEEVTGIVDALFYRFCEARLRGDWNTVVIPEIRDWIQNRAG